MFAKSLSAAALIAALGATGAFAQSRSGPIIPAEVPPASFGGAQYVDSRGCVFIRTGFNGRVNWVPRYGDDRRPMCGQQPTLAAAGAPSGAPASVPMQTAPIVAASRPAPQPSAPQPVTHRPAVASVGSSIPYSVPPEPSRPRATATASAGATVHRVSGPHGLDTRWSFYDRTGPSPCAHMTPHSQMYMVPGPSRPELPLRCGPQAQHPADAVRELAPRGGVWEPWDGVNPSPMAPNVYQLPPAYAPRWPDAHLRPAPQHPRHDGSAPMRQQYAETAAPQVRVSTMSSDAGVSAAPRATSRVAPAASGRFVQVGTFGVPANARATIAQLQARGLPVARSELRRSGQSLEVVMAGPFASPAELDAALQTARAMGFRDAFLR